MIRQGRLYLTWQAKLELLETFLVTSCLTYLKFEVLVKPILVYGSEVWGLKSKLWGSIDIVFLQYSRCILHVKATTNNIITTGECGRFPPGAYCHISALCYINRLHHKDVNKLAKQVFFGILLTSANKASLPGQQTLWRWQMTSD